MPIIVTVLLVVFYFFDSGKTTRSGSRSRSNFAEQLVDRFARVGQISIRRHAGVRRGESIGISCSFGQTPPVCIPPHAYIAWNAAYKQATFLPGYAFFLLECIYGRTNGACEYDPH